MYNQNKQNEQIYGRNDMVMLDGHNKIYGSLGMAEQYVFETVEGNPVVLQNPVEGKVKDVITEFFMQGWTEQDSTTGAQLFDIGEFLELPLEPFASYGNARVLALTLKPNTSYTLSSNNIGAIVGDVNKNRSLYFTTIDDMDITAQSCAVFDGKPVTKISDEEGKLKIVLIDRENADPIVNKEKWVMLNEGDTALPYELYTGGAPSPSPDYPQEIVSAGKYNEDTQKYEVEVKLTGKNLFDQSLLTSKTQGGATVTNNGDGSFTISGSGYLTENLSSLITLSHEETIKLVKSGNITLKCDKPTNPYVFFYYTKN